MRYLPLALAGILLLAAPASAHITFSADGPSDAVQFGTPFEITATAKEICPEVLANENANGISELTLSANASAGFFTATTATLAWDALDCTTTGDDAGYVVGTDTVTVTLGPKAPAGRLPVQIVLDETGTTTSTDVTVLQYASLSGVAATAAHEHIGHDVGEGQAMFGIDIPITVQSNGGLTLRFSIEGQDAPADIAVVNPLTGGSNETVVDVTADVIVPEGEVMDFSLDIEAVDDNGTVLATHSVPFAAVNGADDPCAEATHDHADSMAMDADAVDSDTMAMEGMHHDHGTECLDEAVDAVDDAEAPGVPLVALLAGLVVAVLRRRN